MERCDVFIFSLCWHYLFSVYAQIVPIMDRYKIIKEVGNGTFGSVWRALNKQTGEVVGLNVLANKK